MFSNGLKNVGAALAERAQPNLVHGAREDLYKGDL